MRGATSPRQLSGPLWLNGHRLIEGNIKVVVWKCQVTYSHKRNEGEP